MLGDNFDFWYKQWNVHGKCTYEVMDQSRYFDTAIYIHADVSLTNLFANYIVPMPI
jgi:ribonuclease I